MTQFCSDSLLSPVESPSWHNSFPPRLRMTTKIKWNRHRSFLYGCDRSPEVHVLKLGIEIPNLYNITGLQKWFESSESGSAVTCEEGLAPSQCPFENGTKYALLSSKYSEHAFIYRTLI